MSRKQGLLWGTVITFVIMFLGGCGGAEPTPIVLPPAPASTPVPALPTREPPPPPTETEVPTTAATIDLTTTADLTTTVTAEPPPATDELINLPFLMRIDRVSVIVGRGTFVEGRVAHGILQENADVEILGPQNTVVDSTVLGVFISNTVRDQVVVGDYTGILLRGVEPSQITPGFLLAEAGAYESYEEALQILQ